MREVPCHLDFTVPWIRKTTHPWGWPALLRAPPPITHSRDHGRKRPADFPQLLPALSVLSACVLQAACILANALTILIAAFWSLFQKLLTNLWLSSVFIHPPVSEPLFKVWSSGSMWPQEKTSLAESIITGACTKSLSILHWTRCLKFSYCQPHHPYLLQEFLLWTALCLGISGQ